MEKYETVFIVKPDLVQEKLKEVIKNAEEKIGEYAEILKKQELGLKKLAYSIQKYAEGYYMVYELKIKENTDKGEALNAIERHFRITDEIMKFITVKEG